MENYGFRKLIIWQKSMDIISDIYKMTKSFPKEEIFALTSQMRRAAVSIPSNIAEGTSRKTKNDYQHFMAITRGSSLELETQIEIALRLRYCTEAQSSPLLEKIHEIQKILNKLSLS